MQDIQNYFKSLFYCFEGRYADLHFDRNLYNNLNEIIEKCNDIGFQ